MQSALPVVQRVSTTAMVTTYVLDVTSDTQSARTPDLACVCPTFSDIITLYNNCYKLWTYFFLNFVIHIVYSFVK